MSVASAPDSLPILKLKHGEERRLRAGHLWVFSNEVDTAATPLAGFEPGALALVQDSRNQFVGRAYVNPATLISARILSRLPSQSIDARFFDERLRRAEIGRAHV